MYSITLLNRNTSHSPEAVDTARREVRSRARFKASKAGSTLVLPEGRRQPRWGGVSSLATQKKRRRLKTGNKPSSMIAGFHTARDCSVNVNTVEQKHCSLTVVWILHNGDWNIAPVWKLTGVSFHDVNG